jgi:hypothetical protein
MSVRKPRRIERDDVLTPKPHFKLPRDNTYPKRGVTARRFAGEGGSLYPEMNENPGRAAEVLRFFRVRLTPNRDFNPPLGKETNDDP